MRASKSVGGSALILMEQFGIVDRHNLLCAEQGKIIATEKWGAGVIEVTNIPYPANGMLTRIARFCFAQAPCDQGRDLDNKWNKHVQISVCGGDENKTPHLENQLHDVFKAFPTIHVK